MIDEPFRQWLARRGSAPAAALARAGITADQITVVAAVLGLTAAALVAVQIDLDSTAYTLDTAQIRAKTVARLVSNSITLRGTDDEKQ